MKYTLCGGSDIAAVSPVIKAEEKQMSMALGTVFILNAIALFVFPFIGTQLHLSQSQFGWWCAAIQHEITSPVRVGLWKEERKSFSG